MTRLVDAVADQAEREDGLRPALYAAHLLQRALTPDEPEDTSEDYRSRNQGRRHAGASAICRRSEPPGCRADTLKLLVVG